MAPCRIAAARMMLLAIGATNQWWHLDGCGGPAAHTPPGSAVRPCITLGQASTACGTGDRTKVACHAAVQVLGWGQVGQPCGASCCAHHAGGHAGAGAACCPGTSEGGGALEQAGHLGGLCAGGVRSLLNVLLLEAHCSAQPACTPANLDSPEP